MPWNVKSIGFEPNEELGRRIDTRLRYALARFGGRINRVVVYLNDLRGRTGSIDKSCRVLVKGRGFGVVMAAVIDSDWESAIDRAAARIGHTVARAIERSRLRLHRHTGA